MTSLDTFLDTGTATYAPERPAPKTDWPLIGDVSTVRAGVPEALILWRRARGETPPDAQRG